MRRSRIMEKLRKGEHAHITLVWTVGHWKIVDMMGVAGADGVWIDNEHSDFSQGEISQMILAARARDMDSLVRIPRTGYTSSVKPLEAGATGLVYPHCMGADDAVSIVRDAKFAPLGMRGMGGSVDADYSMGFWDEYTKEANQGTVVVAQIEDREAVDQVDEIARNEGVDVLFMGPADLSQDYGVIGQLDHGLIEDAIDATAAACKRHGKWWGTPVSSLEEAKHRSSQGARFFQYGTEMEILMAGFRQARETIDKLRG